MTVRELAKDLGLSKTTVAAALRNHPTIRAKTRELVQSRARELGYSVNPVASAFLQQIRSRGAVRYKANLALVTAPWGGSLTMGAMYQCMSKRAEELGYGVDSINVEEYDAERLTELLVARGVLGLLIGPMAKAMAHLNLDWTRFASIAFGYTMACPILHRVVPNHLEGIRTAWQECEKKGRRRIGLALSTEGDRRSNGAWIAGYFEMQRRTASVEPLVPLLLPVEEFTADHISDWILQQQPDVILFHHSGQIPRLPELNGGIKSSIPVAVLDRHLLDVCAGIDQQFGLCGAHMVDLLTLQITHNEWGLPSHPSITMQAGMWVDHPSFRAA